MPVTRSSARNAKASSSKLKENGHTEEISSLSDLTDSEPSNAELSDNSRKSPSIEEHMKSALNGFQKLKGQLRYLRQENKELREKIDQLHETESQSIRSRRNKGGAMLQNVLQSRVKKLEGEVARLEKARQKDKKRIKNLRLREIGEDAAELHDVAENGVDMFDSMRKLLRRFDQVITTPSYENGEDCVICCEKIDSKDPISLACEHLLCKPCLHELLKYHAQSNVPEAKCPTCRSPISPDLEGTQTVMWSATEQWDALLEIDQEWLRLDKHGGDEPENTEEESEPFINGSDNESSKSLRHESELEETDNVVTENEQDAEMPDDQGVNDRELEDDENEGPSTPSGSERPRVSYFQSPLSVRRQRMEELVMSRKKKRTNW